ncbi:unnamed protein product [Rhizophagus irregularis]|nr:unnamed protein product [Rhizophagus irregularis]
MATNWYKKAADNGNEVAQHNLDKRQVFDWFEESIEKKEITYYDYKDFNDISKIGSGGFASVYATSWKNTQSKFAIKKFDKLSITINEVKNEIDLMKKVDFHPNIIKFCGVTKLQDELTGGINYLLVLEYADNGTLRKYLKKNFDTFRWERQLNFAKEIASAIVCLHYNGIIHRDLHSNNILVHQHTIKLADFDILEGKRENPVPNTNAKFIKLYQKCWRYEPDERPSIEQVILELNNIDSKNNTSHQVNSELNDSDNVNIENNRIEKSKNTEELERNAIESMNGDLYLSKFLS